MKHTLFIDGMNLFIRSFVVNETTNASGDLVGGFIGFLRSLKSLVRTYRPEKVFVVWEQGGACPRRKKLFPEYKENRAKNKEMGEMTSESSLRNPFADAKNRAYQLQLLTKALGFLPVCQIYVKETECDDIIAYLVKHSFANYDGKKVVVSSDKDFYQLLDYKDVVIFDVGKKHEVDKKYVLDNIGISPKNITLARTLCGDKSDNVPGIHGMGFKTLLKHFPELVSEETDYNSDWLLTRTKELLEANPKKQPKVLVELAGNKEVVDRNWQLMFLDTSAMPYHQIQKIDFKVENYKPVNNKLEFIKIFLANDIAVTDDMDALSTEMRFMGIV